MTKLKYRDDYKVGDILRPLTGFRDRKTLTILEVSNELHGPLVQWSNMQKPLRLVSDWHWQNFERIEPTTFVVGKKYVPAQVPARGITTILAQLDDGDWAFSFEDFKTGLIIVNKLHPSSFVHYKEYVEPPEEWRALYWREHGKPEVSAQIWTNKSDCEAYHSTNDTDLGERNFMYAIRTDEGVRWKNKK